MIRTRTVALPLAGLLVGLLLALAAAPAGAWWPFGPDQPANGSDPSRPATWGRTSSADHVLKKGCERYRYRYRVTAPDREWMAEVFLVDPRGRGVGSRSFHTPADPAQGAPRWKLCRATAGYGRYTIRMKVTWSDGYEQHSGWVKPSYFRMTRR